jgi:hypothetical protein
MANALVEAHPHAQPGTYPGQVLFDGQHPETLPLVAPTASSRHSLSTAVLVGGHSELDAMLSGVLRMDGRNSPWKHATNAVLHYPGPSRTPVIQALNMPVWKEAFEPVTAEAYP